jgi:hypothetical protein
VTVVYLILAVVAAAAAGFVGWPAWRSYHGRQERDLNAERYLAWRGRAPRRSQASGMSAWERRRLTAAGVLAIGAIALAVAFLSAG